MRCSDRYIQVLSYRYQTSGIQKKFEQNTYRIAFQFHFIQTRRNDHHSSKLSAGATARMRCLSFSFFILFVFPSLVSFFLPGRKPSGHMYVSAYLQHIDTFTCMCRHIYTTSTHAWVGISRAHACLVRIQGTTSHTLPLPHQHAHSHKHMR